MYFFKYPTSEIHIFHCISQYLNFPLLSSSKHAGSMFVKKRQIQILGKYSGRYIFQKLDTYDNTFVAQSPQMTQVHECSNLPNEV